MNRREFLQQSVAALAGAAFVSHAGSSRAERAAGFKGVYSIEYEGEGDPHQGVQHVVD